MHYKVTLIFAFILSNLFFVPVSQSEDANEKVEEILSQKEAPPGIVFEIVSGESNALGWALPEAQAYIKELRARFPNIEIAIVTHGDEQFALQKKKSKKFNKVHSLTQQLVEKNNVPIHVCGTYAGWKGVSEEDFPDYVDVAAAGPATINDYIALGYILIKL